jgi:hypothetical protein
VASWPETARIAFSSLPYLPIELQTRVKREDWRVTEARHGGRAPESRPFISDCCGNLVTGGARLTTGACGY